MHQLKLNGRPLYTHTRALNSCNCLCTIPYNSVCLFIATAAISAIVQPFMLFDLMLTEELHLHDGIKLLLGCCPLYGGQVSNTDTLHGFQANKNKKTKDKYTE